MKELLIRRVEVGPIKQFIRQVMNELIIDKMLLLCNNDKILTFFADQGVISNCLNSWA